MNLAIFLNIENFFKGKRVTPAYSNAWCLFAILGYNDRIEAVKKGPIQEIKERYIHPHAFTNIHQHDYNLGKG